MTDKMKWTGLIAVIVVMLIIPAYAWMEPHRQEDLQIEYQIRSVVSATDIYAENCAVCHGASGEGIATNPALNLDAIRQIPESELMKVISRGRYNTLMAAWGQEEGGVLSNSQIGDIVTLIQHGNWEYIQDRVAALGLTPPQVMTYEVSDEMLTHLDALPEGDVLGTGLSIYAESCAACHGPNGAGTIIAPAIDSPDLRSWSDKEITETITQGVPGTLMSGWGEILSGDQVASLVKLINAWPKLVQAGIEFPGTEPISYPATPERIAEGSKLFNIACKSCHGVDGYGTRMAPALNNQVFLSQTPDAAIYQIIAGGVTGTMMPAWGSRLSDQENQAIVAYLRSLESSAPSILPPITGP